MGIDFHGYPLEDALAKAEQIIGRVRMEGRAEEWEFITGFGVIRNELFQLLRDYDLDPTYKLNNPGVVVCLID